VEGRAGTLEEIPQKTKGEENILVSSLFPALISHVVSLGKTCLVAKQRHLGNAVLCRTGEKGGNGSESRRTVGQLACLLPSSKATSFYS